MDHPMYRNIHSNPYQRDQIHYSPHFYPGTQMYSNHSRPPINYGYAPQVPFHGCCNHHTCMPAHYPNWGYPYSHHFPAMPHCPVSYPSFPAQCMPCCPIEQYRYEFDKNVPTTRGQHCCGCPNHTSHPIEPGNVMIEEEEPGSLAPLQLKNGQSPTVLMPPDNNSKMKDNDNSNNQVVWKDGAKNGWYPLDLNNLVSMKEGTGDEERKHQPRDEGEGRRFPFPFFWMPSMPEEKEKENVGDLNTNPSLEPEMSSLDEKKIQVKEEGSKNWQREIDASVKDGGIDPGEKKLKKESVKRTNPFPPKSSKLPPVCLRVDPLPRRKAANGSSRSNEAKSKVTNSSDDKKVCDIVPTNEVNKGKPGKGTKMIEVVDGKTLQEKNMDVNVEARVDQPEVKPEEENSTWKCIENDAMKGCRSEEVVCAIGNNEEGTKEASKRKLSEEEAAVIIQAVYRGFDTRRWDLVKKLKEIAEVRDQIDSLKHMVQAMVSSSAIEGSSKQRNVISETIMNLLLKLDTIQGWHQSIRETRKSVVKELVSLQEQLDSVMIEKTSKPPQQESNLECEENASNKAEDAVLSENSDEVPYDLSEADQNQLNGAFICENSETSEANEVLMDKLYKEDEKRKEGLKNDEISDRAEVPNLPCSSLKGVDFVQSDRDEFDNELAELPRRDLDDFYAQEKKNCQEENRMLTEVATVTSESQNHERDNVMEADIKTGHEDKLEHEEPIEIKSDVEVSDANESFISGKAIDNPPEKEMSGDYLLHEDNWELDTVEETYTSVKEPENDTIEENANGDEKIGVQDEMDVLVHGKGEGLTESNKKLIEENERLRGVMENLIKSGQEQLTAISSLTGRVRDLERKLSKKKKLKVKQSKIRKMRGLVHE